MTVTPEQLASLLDFRKLIGQALLAFTEGYSQMTNEQIQEGVEKLNSAVQGWKQMDVLAEGMQKTLRDAGL